MSIVQDNQGVYLGKFCPSTSLSDSCNLTVDLLAPYSIWINKTNQYGSKAHRDIYTKDQFLYVAGSCMTCENNTKLLKHMQCRGEHVWKLLLPCVMTRLSDSAFLVPANPSSQNKGKWKNMSSRQVSYRQAIHRNSCFVFKAMFSRQ